MRHCLPCYLTGGLYFGVGSTLAPGTFFSGLMQFNGYFLTQYPVFPVDRMLQRVILPYRTESVKPHVQGNKQATDSPRLYITD